jgi:hypothetical protein
MNLFNFLLLYVDRKIVQLDSFKWKRNVNKLENRKRMLLVCKINNIKKLITFPKKNLKKKLEKILKFFI